MAKRDITINDEQATILGEAIQSRCSELEKIAVSLMKKKLSDAAAPVYAEIKRLQKMAASVRGENKDEE